VGSSFFWDTVTRWSDRKQRRTIRIIVLNLAFIGMSLWLLNTSHSATSRLCLVLGWLVIRATHTKMFQRHPGILKWSVPVLFVLYLILAFGFNINAHVAGAVGREPNTHRQNQDMGIPSQHAHESAPWHRLREFLARSSAPVVLGEFRPRPTK
jgi:hypothetical protein